MSGPFGAGSLQYFSGGAADFYNFPLEQSLRFNDDDSAYLSWTPDSAGNRKTWTWSGWVKRGNLGQQIIFFVDRTGSNNEGVVIGFDSSNTLFFYQWNGSSYDYQLETNAVFRDPSSWYHIVCVLDTTDATADDRQKLYINGVQITSFASRTNASLNFDGFMSDTKDHYISRTTSLFDGYLAEVNFIDGTALDASSFGELKNGVWIPKDPSGLTYGTNGFRLSFADDAEVEAFNTVLYRGDGVDGRSMTGMGFQPDLVWIKQRNSTAWHNLFDAVRGTGEVLFSNSTDQESTNNSNGYLSAFDSDGFTLTEGSGTFNNVNGSGSTYVAWGWKAGDSNVSNTDGSITSTVRANTTYGFSIVSYEGTGANATVGHGLSSAPNMIIVKNRDASSNWYVGHDGVDATSPWSYRLILQDTDARGNEGAAWNDTAPTSSVFSIGTSGATNGSTQDHIAYCWAEKAGYSKFGSYSGGTNPKTITTTFKPAWVLIKRTDGGADHWFIFDNTRTVSQDANAARLLASSSATEGVGSSYINFTDTGFTLPQTHESTNGSGMTYIYAAFADTREAAFWLDQSGNNNDWQPVNLDHNDTVADSPTDNFATLNPLNRRLTTNAPTYSDGNLVLQGQTVDNQKNNAIATIQNVKSGKYYAEMTVLSIGVNASFGVSDDPVGSNGLAAGNNYHVRYDSDGDKSIGSASSETSSAYGASYTTGDVIGLAVDIDNGTIEFFKNGVSQGTASSDLDTNMVEGYTIIGYSGKAKLQFNFGQQPFKYDPPA